MNDVVLTALVSSAGVSLVAISGAAATIFGPARREHLQRRDERLHALDDLRYARTSEFLDALATLIPAWSNRIKYEQAAAIARNRLIATLRPGESPVEKFTSELLNFMMGSPGENDLAQEYLGEGANRLYRWLRAEITPDQLLPFLITGSAGSPIINPGDFPRR
jgi:hypothetical protein